MARPFFRLSACCGAIETSNHGKSPTSCWHPGFNYLWQNALTCYSEELLSLSSPFFEGEGTTQTGLKRRQTCNGFVIPCKSVFVISQKPYLSVMYTDLLT